MNIKKRTKQQLIKSIAKDTYEVTLGDDYEFLEYQNEKKILISNKKDKLVSLRAIKSKSNN